MSTQAHVSQSSGQLGHYQSHVLIDSTHLSGTKHLLERADESPNITNGVLGQVFFLLFLAAVVAWMGLMQWIEAGDPLDWLLVWDWQKEENQKRDGVFVALWLGLALVLLTLIVAVSGWPRFLADTTPLRMLHDFRQPPPLK